MALTNSYMSLFRKPATTTKPVTTTSPNPGPTPWVNPGMTPFYPTPWMTAPSNPGGMQSITYPGSSQGSYPAPGLPISYPAPGYQQPGYAPSYSLPAQPINMPYTGVKPGIPYSPPGGYQPTGQKPGGGTGHTISINMPDGSKVTGPVGSRSVIDALAMAHQGGATGGTNPQFQQPNYSNMPYFLQQLLGLGR